MAELIISTTEPTIVTLGIKPTLTNPLLVGGKTVTDVNIQTLIFRPIIKRIVFNTTEFNRVVLYDGDTEYATHVNDGQEALIRALFANLDATYPHAGK